MFRPLVLLALLTAAAVVTAAPAPDLPSPAPYHPTRVGDRREYLSNAGVTNAYVVTTAERKDGGWLVTEALLLENGNPGAAETFLVSAAGVASVANNLTGRHAAPRWLLKLPAGETRPASGLKWDWTFAIPQGGVKHTYSLGEEEEVEVPAGKFRAIRVEMLSSGQVAGQPTTPLRMEAWHARRVGVVKEVHHVAQGKGLVRELRKFTPGKE